MNLELKRKNSLISSKDGLEANVQTPGYSIFIYSVSIYLFIDLSFSNT